MLLSNSSIVSCISVRICRKSPVPHLAPNRTANCLGPSAQKICLPYMQDRIASGHCMQRWLASLMARSRDNVTPVEIIRCTFDKSVKKGVCCKGCPELSQAHAARVKRRLPLGSAQRLQLHHFTGASTQPGPGGGWVGTLVKG